MSNEETPPGGEPAADQLTDELAKKYDPERLLRMLAKRAGKGESLEHSVRNRYEKKFGVDLGHVRIYTGEFAEEFNRQKGSYAVTIGGTGAILMGGSPEKTGAAGQALLAHELTHVAQQQRGLGGGLHRKAVIDMPFAEEHEHEADAVEHAEHAEALGGSVHEAVAAAMKGEEGKGADAASMAEQIEKIKQRVLDMMADAVRHQTLRNGLVRRA
ncbi:MAG: DUF4157 domain-containing protein [Deltaproteobacteria bacterium]|nr:DUF4157 domain-containing protein [Deltaproteobacteria bacterium]